MWYDQQQPSETVTATGSKLGSRSPGAPVLVGSVEPYQSESWGDVAVESQYAYATTGSSWMRIVDISNLASPVIVGGDFCGAGCANGLAVAGPYLYVSSSHYGVHLDVYDITTPSAPTFLASTPVLSAGRVISAGQFVYISEGWPPGPAQVVDVSTPSAPKLVGSMPKGQLAVGDSYACVADGTFYVIPAQCSEYAVGVGDRPSCPHGYVSAYPNPFNPLTTVRFTVSEPGEVTVAVFGVNGQKIATLVDHERRDAGVYSEHWSGRSSHGTEVPSGVYFVRVEQGPHVTTTTITLLK